MEKIKVPQVLINIGVAIIIAAYGYIFSSIIERISSLEYKVENLNPVFMQIQSDLSAIRKDIEWLTRNTEK